MSIKYSVTQNNSRFSKTLLLWNDCTLSLQNTLATSLKCWNAFNLRWYYCYLVYYTPTLDYALMKLAWWHHDTLSNRFYRDSLLKRRWHSQKVIQVKGNGWASAEKNPCHWIKCKVHGCESARQYIVTMMWVIKNRKWYESHHWV